MQTLSWYYRRLKAMTPDEIAGRMLSSLRDCNDLILVGWRQRLRKLSTILNEDGNNIVANVANSSFNRVINCVLEVSGRSTMHHNLLFQPNDSARVNWDLGSPSLSEILTTFQQRTGEGAGCIARKEVDPTIKFPVEP